MTPGVIITSTFDEPVGKGSKAASPFSEYVEYIDREKATQKSVRQVDEKLYLNYTDYMDNPEKSTGLFSFRSMKVDDTEKERLKGEFEAAQENGSLLWKTVVSFDNDFLKENNILLEDRDPETGKEYLINEDRLKSITAAGIREMLKKENMENAVWCAAIHYNTDNIHVHFAITEPDPHRKQKEYTVYRWAKDEDGKRVRIPVLDENGDPKKEKKYVGRFKPSSFKAGKRVIVNMILNERETNARFADIIRNDFVGRMRKTQMAKDARFVKDFLDIYDKLPRPNPKDNYKLWNYNMNVMDDIRPDIDAFTERYLNTYMKGEYETFKADVQIQQEKYERAYGGISHYAENKMKDLRVRMGNALLKEMKEYDRTISKDSEYAKRSSRKYDVPMHKRTQYGPFPGTGSSKKTSYYINQALNALRRAARDETENAHNQYEYDRMSAAKDDGR